MRVIQVSFVPLRVALFVMVQKVGADSHDRLFAVRARDCFILVLLQFLQLRRLAIKKN